MKLIARKIYLLVVALFTNYVCFSQEFETELSNAFAFASEQKYEEALAEIQKIKSAHPTVDSAYAFATMLQFEIYGQNYYYSELMKEYEKKETEIVLKNFFSEAKESIHANVATVRKNLGDFDGALKMYAGLISNSEDKTTLYNNIANTYLEAGQYTQAIEYASKVPDSLGNKYFILAASYFGLDNIKSANQALNKYISSTQASNDYEAYLLAAKIYVNLNDNEKAKEYIIKAKELTTSDGGVSSFIAAVPQRAKNYYIIKKHSRQVEEINTLAAKYLK